VDRVRERHRSRSRAVVGLVLIVASLAAGATPSGAQAERSRAEVAELARAAGSDDAALAELRTIEQVDGQPVDLEAATAGVERAPDRAARLEALGDELAAGAVGAGPDGSVADAARGDARAVLEGDEYRADGPPRPFKGAIDWLGDRLEPVGRVLGDVFGPVIDVIDDIPGGPYLVAAAMGALLAWAIARFVARRSRARVARSGDGRRLLVDLDADPDALLAAADAAEAEGDLAAAVRLRYEAGLLRLVRAGRLELHPETTPRTAAEQVGGAVLGGLTSSFEEIVYGGRTASAADVAAARAGWPQVLDRRSKVGAGR
jgi:hypothetical protein